MLCLLTVSVSETKNTQVDNVESLDVEMPMYNLTEHSNNNSKLLRQYCRDEPDDNLRASKLLNSNLNLKTVLVMLVR